MRDWTTTIEARNESVPHTATVDSAAKLKKLQAAIEAVVRGKTETVKLAIVALLANGHVLIEDVPGVGKTTLAHALALALDASFQRIQFTSDLLPSDVLGRSVFDQRSSTFEWQPGAIFSNVILADEINRATPKTQSALLEAMAEGQVTTEGVTRTLPTPFVVLATQNPVEHHGTYPLPESQLDRFMLRLTMGYPSFNDEKRILHDRERSDPLSLVRPVLSVGDISDLQRRVTEIRVDESLIDYLMEIVAATRATDKLELGVSPRGSLALFRAAQALALVEGREFCQPDDIKRLVVPCFAHRVISSQALTFNSNQQTAENVLHEILSQTAVPV
ncbi:MAG: MoxR family ATPase [Pyrinomonadaceae bacterium]